MQRARSEFMKTEIDNSFNGSVFKYALGRRLLAAHVPINPFKDDDNHFVFEQAPNPPGAEITTETHAAAAARLTYIVHDLALPEYTASTERPYVFNVPAEFQIFKG
jgi:hypothetical protein